MWPTSSSKDNFPFTISLQNIGRLLIHIPCSELTNPSYWCKRGSCTSDHCQFKSATLLIVFFLVFSSVSWFNISLFDSSLWFWLLWNSKLSKLRLRRLVDLTCPKRVISFLCFTKSRSNDIILVLSNNS